MGDIIPMGMVEVDMRLGIVGHAQEKFVFETEHHAREAIRDAIALHAPSAIVSGHSPMGGVDWYAEEIANELEIPAIIYAPQRNTWYGPCGYRERNLKIAAESDIVLVVVVKQLPPGYKGMRFSGCYHCKERTPEHVKSGGCWTAWRAKAQEWIII